MAVLGGVRFANHLVVEFKPIIIQYKLVALSIFFTLFSMHVHAMEKLECSNVQPRHNLQLESQFKAEVNKQVPVEILRRAKIEPDRIRKIQIELYFFDVSEAYFELNGKLLSIIYKYLQYRAVADENDINTELKTEAEAFLDRHGKEKLPEKNGGEKGFNFTLDLIGPTNELPLFDNQCNLTIEEFTALKIYMLAGYVAVNNYLRTPNSKKNTKLEYLSFLITNALNKIQNYKGMVYRSTRYGSKEDLPESVYRTYVKGKNIKLLGFTSTSTKFENLMSDVGKMNFKITSKTGRNLTAINRDENEVLFLSGTRFRVISNSCEEQQAVIWQDCDVELEEVAN